MKIKMKLHLFLPLCLFISACDEGKIYPSDTAGDNASGFSVVTHAEISGYSDFYGEDFSLVVAAFKEGNRFAAITKVITPEEKEVVLNNIPGDASTVELCVVNRLRERIFTLSSITVAQDTHENVQFDAGNVDASPFSLIERGVFDVSCARCHGASGHSAAGLNLLPEQAYSMLVDKASSVVEGEYRVMPGNAAKSTLWEALATDISDSWAFSHTNLLSSEKTDFIEYWINKGAEK